MKKAYIPVFIILSYSSMIFAWYILNQFRRDSLWWLFLFNYIAPYLFIPSLPLVILAVLQRKKRRFMVIMITAMVPILIFVLLYKDYLIPRWSDSSTQPVIKMMTYNILFSNNNYDGLVNVIKSNNPDLIALQEAQLAAVAAFKSRLKGQYPYSITAPPHPYGTTAIFSKYPFSESYILDLKADRAAVVATLKVEEQEITIVSAHLLAFGLQWVPWHEIPTTIRQRIDAQNLQAQILLNSLEHHENLIIACDCNSKETNSTYRILSKKLINVVHQIGWRPNTFLNRMKKSDNDLRHIDYIFYKGLHLQPFDAYKVIDTGGSDHEPLVALFNIVQ